MTTDVMRELPYEDALEAANAWNDVFPKNSVRLRACDEMESIVSSYEWVEFYFLSQGSDLEPLAKLVRAARAASIAWTKLSSCRGYGGRENSTFWKLLFGGFAAPGFSETRVSEVPHFFKYNAFPRFRLVLGGALSMETFNVMCRLFCGNEDDLQAISPLEPFIRPEEANRKIEVCIHVPFRDPVQFVPTVSNTLASIEQAAALESGSARFRVHAIEFQPIILESESRVNALIGLFRDVSVEVSNLTIQIGEYLAREAISHLLLTICNVGPHKTRAKFRELSIPRILMSDRILGAIFSILPHTRSLQRLSFGFEQRVRDDPSVDYLWHWFDYALLHPDISQSSWRQFRLNYFPVTRAGCQLFLQNVKPSDRRSVQLRAGALLYDQPGDDATIVTSAEAFQSVDVCKWVMNSSSSTSGWLCVVMPGFGYGWVKCGDIVDERTQTVSPTSYISALSYIPSHRTQKTWETRVLLELLRRYGHEIRYLDTSTLSTTDSQVQAILQVTPKLEAFRSGHVVSLWRASTNVGEPDSQRLRELALPSLGTNPDQLTFQGLFANLEMLELCVSREAQHPAFEELASLLQLNPKLESLYYLVKDSFAFKEYASIRSKSRLVLGIQDGKTRSVALTPLPRKSRFAFCSVAHKVVRHGIEFDHSDVIARIFDYAAVGVPRKVWIDTHGD
ncbi:hypothetical protein Poli38472_001258 [Pythium oligandrum]|uniref:Uncharacterized protein n=1 Tax=Pythium oligandrum TaxID=41045 RepID=A0A8K1CUI7_PYTOL|nr:hypothetical protein Poli38472_001258 [Pythium oligandrum]|eukprot:TMW69102.1 hypothetical protein Poli38472_001258 [Pythium oligandrum]